MPTSVTTSCTAGRHRRTQKSVQGYTPLFTDGSWSPSGVGCVFVSGSTTCSIFLPNDASIFLAELHAIVLAQTFMRTHTSSHTLTNSLSDSLTFHTFTYHLIQCCLNVLARCTSDYFPMLLRTPLSAHCGITYLVFHRQNNKSNRYISCENIACWIAGEYIMTYHTNKEVGQILK